MLVDIPFDENIQVSFPIIIGTIPVRLQDSSRPNVHETENALFPGPSSTAVETGIALSILNISYSNIIQHIDIANDASYLIT